VKKVSILILTFNRVKLTEEFVPQIINRIGSIDAEVLIWDNGSEDGTYDWLENYGIADCRVTKVFGSDRNYGVEAINFLAEQATGEYILKIDDDILPPNRFAEFLVRIYEIVNEPKLAYLAWDMPWRETSFALRSGRKLYNEPNGKTVFPKGMAGEVLISYDTHPWLVNGACRLSPRQLFLDLGGHPKDVIYGVDYIVTKRAKKHGYWIGFYSGPELISHRGTVESREYRKMKDELLEQHGAPKHV
jgi:GT2 family glycosyltransferase